jgi:putative MATE family efflux protein
MTDGSIPGKMLRFAFPVFIGNLFQQLYNTADALIVGNFLGSTALAAVTGAGNLVFLITGFFIGLAMGASVVISTYIGARDKENIKKAVHTDVALGLISSVLMTFVGIVFAPQALRLMDTPADVLPLSVLYFRLYFVGAAGMVMYNTFVSILQAAGDSKHPLYYLMLSSGLNIALDIIFIKYFHMGVGGAAIATTIAQFCSAGMAMYRLLHVDDDYRLIWRDVKLNKFMLKKIMGIGLPSACQNSIIGFANVVVQSYINYFGEMAIAGTGAYVKIEGFAFLPITSFAMALTTFTGQNRGAGRFDRVKKGAVFGTICSLSIAELIGIFIYILSPILIAAFDSTPKVVAFGVERARFVSLFFFLLAFSHIMAALFRGLGKSMFPMIVMLVAWCVIRVSILAFTGMIHRTFQMTYYVYPITWAISSVIFIALAFKYFHDLKKGIISKEL